MRWQERSSKSSLEWTLSFAFEAGVFEALFVLFVLCFVTRAVCVDVLPVTGSFVTVCSMTTAIILLASFVKAAVSSFQVAQLVT